MTTTIPVLAPCSVHLGSQGLADEFRRTVEAHQVPVAQRCDVCEAAYFPPLLGCRQCGSSQLSWIGCGETGTVGTFVTVHTTRPTPSMSIPGRLLDQVPYTSVYVVPDDLPGVRLAALMVGPQQEELAVGLPVRLDATNPRVLQASVASGGDAAGS